MDREERNPFRLLMETWLIQEIVFHHDENGMLVKMATSLDDFSDNDTRAAYRSAVISDGDFRKFVRSFREDYSERTQRAFWSRLAIMKKTAKDESRDDWLSDLDIDELLGVLRRDDDGEIIGYCLDKGLCSNVGEQNGHSSEVRGVRP